MNRWCLLSAVGQSSLHRNWIGEKALYDVHLIVYDNSFEEFKHDTPYVSRSKGYKFNLVHEYLTNNISLVDKYEYFYIPDDDILIDIENINRLFQYMKKYKLALAQPAIANSYYSHPHTFKRENSILRYTNFVEIMQPCFSRRALKKLLFTFNGTKSGWGIDLHWGTLIDHRKNSMAIIDDINSVHTRPVQSNHFEEMREYLRKNNLVWTNPFAELNN